MRVTLVVAAAAVAALAPACVTSRVEKSFEGSVESGSGAGIVVLARRQNVERETEGGFLDCVKKSMQSGSGGVRLGSEREFLDSLFPWFEPRLAPLSVENLPELLAKPGVASRVANSGIRYVVWLDGSTETVDGGGTISCDISVGCFGFNWWEKGATYEASIWDLKDARSMGVVSADVSGRSYLPAIVVPIPLIAPTRSTACKGLANELRNHLGGT